ncbi:hypothetical protein [Clostridium sp. DL1XJH146]
MENRKDKIVKIFIITISSLLVLCILMTVTDYFRTTHSFEKPVFTRCINGYDDGGSGTYIGIGYSIEIEGNFMPEDEFQGVTHAQFSFFGKEVKDVIRD